MPYKYTNTMADLFPDLLECDHNESLFSKQGNMDEVKIWHHIYDGKVEIKYYYLVCGTCGEELKRWW